MQELFDNFEQQAVDDVMDYKGSDPRVLQAKQMAARIMKETKAVLNQHIEDAIRTAREMLFQINEVNENGR